MAIFNWTSQSTSQKWQVVFLGILCLIQSPWWSQEWNTMFPISHAECYSLGTRIITEIAVIKTCMFKQLSKQIGLHSYGGGKEYKDRKWTNKKFREGISKNAQTAVKRARLKTINLKQGERKKPQVFHHCLCQVISMYMLWLQPGCEGCICSRV